MKRIITVLILIMLFSFSVSGEALSTEEFLEQQASLSGADRLEEALPEESRDFLKEKNISPDKTDWAADFTLTSVFKGLWESLTERAKAPISCGGLIIAVILIGGALNSSGGTGTSSTAMFAVTAISCAAIAPSILKVIGSAVELLQSFAGFMTVFIPVFAVIVSATGQVATSASMSALLLGATQGVELIAGYFVMPLICGSLSLNIASCVSPLLDKSNIGEALKKLSFWVLSLATTVFLGVLSIQTTISASGDSLSVKTARFIIGSSVPVAGTVLSEALTTVTASLGVLKASVAIYGVIACAVIFLPLLLELLVWRLMLNIIAVLSDAFAVGGIGGFLKGADSVLSILCGILLLTGALFIISLTVVVSAGKGV